MAGREYCKFNKNIKCDSLYEQEEFYKVLTRAFESGKTASFYCSKGGICDKRYCLRYLEGMVNQATVNCPYDDTHCQLKAEKLAEFRKQVRRLAENGTNQVFFEPADDACPVDYTACLRYQRYLNIMNKIKAGEKQK